ncbi:MAG: deoxyribose-phosphate aldolase [Bacteroidetes bacterium]|nr:deoxyribose-phosphate aldolase [Bacteroidota bacterium]MCL2301629.1 deoxyribose-phosphate aldolase [Lentimicrobiaceae bacterium]
MITLPNYSYSLSEVQARIEEIKKQPLENFSSEKEAIRFALHCIDLTTLEGNDNTKKIELLCENAMRYQTAAVCVYPVFIHQAKQLLKNTSIKVASVAGAFPHGQLPIELKVAEVEYAVAQGADEIDMVISRGLFLEEKYETVFNEIVAIKKACQQAHLKVILETGELIEPDSVYKASMLAMRAGADFIKTSTGKIATNATPEAFLVMLDAICQFYNETKKKIGIKPAGGITDVSTTLLYLNLLEKALNTNWLSNTFLRIGASRLAVQLYNFVEF